MRRAASCLLPLTFFFFLRGFLFNPAVSPSDPLPRLSHPCLWCAKNFMRPLTLFAAVLAWGVGGLGGVWASWSRFYRCSVAAVKGLKLEDGDDFKVGWGFFSRCCGVSATRWTRWSWNQTHSRSRRRACSEWISVCLWSMKAFFCHSRKQGSLSQHNLAGVQFNWCNWDQWSLRCSSSWSMWKNRMRIHSLRSLGFGEQYVGLNVKLSHNNVKLSWTRYCLHLWRLALYFMMFLFWLLFMFFFVIRDKDRFPIKM